MCHVKTRWSLTTVTFYHSERELMGNCSENILFRFLDEIIGLPVTGNYSHRMHHTVVCIIIKSHIFQPAASLNPLTDVVIDVDHGYNTKFDMLKSVFSGVAGHIVLLDDQV